LTVRARDHSNIKSNITDMFQLNVHFAMLRVGQRKISDEMSMWFSIIYGKVKLLEIRALLCNAQTLCALPEHFGQCKNNHFNTQIWHTLVAKVYLVRIQVGKIELNTAACCAHLNRMVFIRTTRTTTRDLALAGGCNQSRNVIESNIRYH